jgi:hypothetical protein
MKKFCQWLQEKLQENTEHALPPIPSNFVRATNFTNPTVGSKLLSGEPFKYGRGMITSSTDAFSSNEEVWNLLITGKTENFDRNSFGYHVVLLDIPNVEYRQHSNPIWATGEIDNSRILGIFNRKTQQLEKNPNYNPHKPIEPLQTRARDGGRRHPTPTQTSTPTPTDSDTQDIW